MWSNTPWYSVKHIRIRTHCKTLYSNLLIKTRAQFDVTSTGTNSQPCCVSSRVRGFKPFMMIWLYTYDFLYMIVIYYDVHMWFLNFHHAPFTYFHMWFLHMIIYVPNMWYTHMMFRNYIWILIMCVYDFPYVKIKYDSCIWLLVCDVHIWTFCKSHIYTVSLWDVINYQ